MRLLLPMIPLFADRVDAGRSHDGGDEDFTIDLVDVLWIGVRKAATLVIAIIVIMTQDSSNSGSDGGILF